MKWWGRLKVWQKAGVVVGCIHVVIYLTLYMLLRGSMGIILLYDLEAPWLFMVSWVIRDFTWSGDQFEIIVLGIAGTIAYSLIGALITLALNLLTQEKGKL